MENQRKPETLEPGELGKQLARNRREIEDEAQKAQVKFFETAKQENEYQQIQKWGN